MKIRGLKGLGIDLLKGGTRNFTNRCHVMVANPSSLQKYYGICCNQRFPLVGPKIYRRQLITKSDILSPLRKGHNLIYLDNSHSGKSFSAFVYAVEKARLTPEDLSVIVVPNHSLLLKFKYWCIEAVKGIHPLTFTLVDRSLNKVVVSSRTNGSGTIPIVDGFREDCNIIILHQEALEKLSTNVIFLRTGLIIIDEADFLVSSIMHSNNSFAITTTPPKGKFKLVLENCIRAIRSLKVQSGNYPTIQFCFLLHQHHPYFQNFSQTVGKFDINDRIGDMIKLNDDELMKNKGQQIEIGISNNFSIKNFFNGHKKKVNVAYKYIEEIDGKPHVRGISLQNYPEKSKFTEHFRMQQVDFKEYYRSLFKASKLPHHRLADKLDVVISQFRKTFKNNEPILIVVPSSTGIHSAVEGFNLKLLTEQVVGVKPVKSIVNPKLFTSASLNLAPDYPTIRDFFNLDFKKLGGEDSNVYNLVYPANELPGMDIENVKNIILLGQVNLVEMAGLQWDKIQLEKCSKLLPGLKHPLNDLYQYYLSKFQLDDNKEANMMIVQDWFNQPLEDDLRTLRNQILANDLGTLTNDIKMPGDNMLDFDKP